VSDVTPYEADTTVTTYSEDPTGGRLLAWARAAAAAGDLARSIVKTSFVPMVGPKNNKRPLDVGTCAAMILAGDELGFTPLAAMRSIYLVHGTPALNAKAMAALVMSRGHDFWVVEKTDTKCVVGGKRRGSDHEQTATWTMDRARKAGYTAANPKYQTNPAEMLYARAVSEICRMIAPDVIAGMPYTVEEIEDEQPATTKTVTRESTTRKPVSRKKPAPDEPPLDEPAAAPPGESPSDTATGTPEPSQGGETPEAPRPEDQPEIIDAEVVDDEPMTNHTRKHLFALLNELGIDDATTQRAGMEKVLGRPVTSRSTLTELEGVILVNDLKERKRARDGDENFPPTEEGEDHADEEDS